MAVMKKEVIAGDSQLVYSLGMSGSGQVVKCKSVMLKLYD